MSEIRTREVDLSFRIQSQGSASAGTVGAFAWGPVNKPVHISGGVEQLIQTFLAPRDTGGDVTRPNSNSFLACENFLLYSNSLYVVRAEGDAAKNAVTDGGTAKLFSNNTATAVEDAQTAFTDASFAARYPSYIGNSLGVSIADVNGFDGWDFEGKFDLAPGVNEVHIVVYDVDGGITGVAGTVLERHSHLSVTPGAKKYDGTDAYYATVLGKNSSWILAGGLGFVLTAGVYDEAFSGGLSDSANADFTSAWQVFANKENVDLSFLFVSDLAMSGPDVQAAIDVATGREDCVCFYSPADAGISADSGVNVEDAVLTYRLTTINRDTSYASMDSAGVKVAYDKYADREVYIPLCSDIAGLYAQTFNRNRPWTSAAGHNRGQIKNIIRLPFNPSSATREKLRKAGINPVVSFPGEGTFLYGDKTTLSSPSAFRDLNVRFLFIALRKSIARSARYQLFEFNDEVTRSLFRSAVNAYLADVEAERGLQRDGYYVKADSENNTAQVIDSNEFVASIFLKPSRTINQIELNFVATPTGVDFKEVERAAR